MLPAYKHNKLPAQSAIRLVRLLGGGSEDVLQCEIVTTFLEESQNAYEALSYVWGEVDNKPVVQINAGESRSQLDITENLAAALHRLRFPSSTRTLWIDSICIDQCNDDEKAYQIPLMGDIYRKASRVLIWLGDGSGCDTTDMAFECINQLNTASEIIEDAAYQSLRGLASNSTEVNQIFGITRPSPKQLHASLGLPDLESPEFRAFRELLRSPWFSRAWTWQESFVARDAIFFYGGKSWGRKRMQKACVTFHKLREVSGVGFMYGDECAEAISMLHNEDLEHSQGCTQMTILLSRRRGAGCKYPSDLLYSLLGAAQNCVDVEINYRQNFEIIFTKSAWQIMCQQGNLSILCELERNRLPSALPTWAPDWRVKVLLKRDSLTISDVFRYRATGTSRACPTLSADSKVLTLSGIYWDSVKAVYSSGVADDEKWVVEMFGSDKLQELYPPTGETLERALRRVRFLDRTDSLDGGKAARWKSDSHELVERLMKNERSSQESKIAYGRLLQTLVRNRECRSLFITEKGRLGIAADTIQRGDTIAMMLGGDRPLVLRRVEAPNHYNYVADCYAHGYMDGESLVDARKGVDPAWDPSDKTWLEELHEGKLPFPVQDFHIH